MRRICYYAMALYLAIGVWGVWAADKIRSVEADVVRVIDGDTIEVDARVWVGQRVRVKVRISGINTPEKRGKCPGEKALAKKAAAYLTKLVGGKIVTLFEVKNGKFAGRVLAFVSVGEIDVTTAMIKRGLAREYHGGKRDPMMWCRERR